MADKLRELAHRFRAARADGKLRLPWEKPMPYRRFSPRPGVIIVTDPYPASRDPNEGRRHRSREPMSTRMRRGLQAVDEWLELPDLARKVLLKAGKIATAAVPVLGVGRVCYFELKRLREHDGPEPGLDGYEHARARVLSYVRGEPSEDPSATFVQSIKDLCNPFYRYKKPANEEPTKNPAKKPVEEKSARGIEEIEAAKVKLLKWRNGDKDKGKEEPENKGSATGQVLQGSAAAPKK